MDVPQASRAVNPAGPSGSGPKLTVQKRRDFCGGKPPDISEQWLTGRHRRVSGVTSPPRSSRAVGPGDCHTPSDEVH